MLFKLPDGQTAVSVEGIEFTANAEGIINATGCLPVVLHKLEHQAKATPIIGAEAEAILTQRKAPGQIDGGHRVAFRLPDGHASVSVAGVEYFGDKNGEFIVESCTPEIEFSLLQHAKCTRGRLPNFTPEQRLDRASLQKRLLDDFGIKVDGRTTMANMEAILENALAEQAAKEAADRAIAGAALVA